VRGGVSADRAPGSGPGLTAALRRGDRDNGGGPHPAGTAIGTGSERGDGCGPPNHTIWIASKKPLRFRPISAKRQRLQLPTRTAANDAVAQDQQHARRSRSIIFAGPSGERRSARLESGQAAHQRRRRRLAAPTRSADRGRGHRRGPGSRCKPPAATPPRPRAAPVQDPQPARAPTRPCGDPKPRVTALDRPLTQITYTGLSAGRNASSFIRTPTATARYEVFTLGPLAWPRRSGFTFLRGTASTTGHLRLV
jgi:hypothetical protein